MHFPWLRQGLEAHSLMLVWQFGPAGATQDTLRRDLGWRERWTAGGKKKGGGGFHDKNPHNRGRLLTGEAGAARANVAAGHVLAGAAVHARVGLALVVVDVAVLAAPARVTRALVAEGGKRECMKLGLGWWGFWFH